MLPQPQEFDITGTSSLKFEDVKNYFSTSQKEIPIGIDLLEGKSISSDASNS